MATLDSTAAREPLPWRAWFVSLLTIILVAVPVVLAFTLGCLDRCVRLIVAASVEAFVAGRGPRA